jgi:hypothetical protein
MPFLLVVRLVRSFSRHAARSSHDAKGAAPVTAGKFIPPMKGVLSGAFRRSPALSRNRVRRLLRTSRRAALAASRESLPRRRGGLVGIGKVDATAFTTLAGTLLGGVVGLMKSSPVTDADSSPRA